MFNLFKRKFADQWRCNSCNIVSQYVDGVLTPGCSTNRNAACPLIPIDTKGRDMTFDEWKKAVALSL